MIDSQNNFSLKYLTKQFLSELFSKIIKKISLRLFDQQSMVMINVFSCKANSKHVVIFLRQQLFAIFSINMRINFFGSNLVIWLDPATLITGIHLQQPTNENLKLRKILWSFGTAHMPLHVLDVSLIPEPPCDWEQRWRWMGPTRKRRRRTRDKDTVSAVPWRESCWSRARYQGSQAVKYVLVRQKLKSLNS